MSREYIVGCWTIRRAGFAGRGFQSGWSLIHTATQLEAFRLHYLADLRALAPRLPTLSAKPTGTEINQLREVLRRVGIREIYNGKTLRPNLAALDTQENDLTHE